MKEVQTKSPTDCGIIIGRFMIHELHSMHIDLIQTVLDKHDRVIVFLGVAPIRCTKSNPLDYKHREALVKEHFPQVEVYPLYDNRSNEVWSKNLDKEIGRWLIPMQTATLYGSRESFKWAYSGKYPVIELESEMNISASQVRKHIINNYPSSKDFRAGVIAATGMKWPTSYQTVDIAIYNEETKKWLMAKKPGEPKWRFVGGYSDVKSNSLEEDARREVQEETGIEVTDLIYIGSTKINDWRMKGTGDCIKTVLFLTNYMFGTAEAADDIEFTNWMTLDEIKSKETNIMEEHHVLVDMLMKHLEKSLTNPKTEVM